MDQIHLELLLSIFKKLESNEMVKVMRVCKRWFEVINGNKTLWRSLILAERGSRYDGESRFGWDPSIADLFDRKSQSSLHNVQVTLQVDPASVPLLADAFISTLLKSKQTLQHLEVYGDDHLLYRFAEVPFQLPHLIDCIVDESAHLTGDVRLKKVSGARKTSSAPTLRTLWIRDLQCLLPSHLHHLTSLVSLHVCHDLSTEQLRPVLEVCAKNLKDLEIAVGGAESQAGQLSPLDFPKLEVLDLMCDVEFPSWIKIPSSSTLILGGAFNSTPNHLPSVSSLWLNSRTNFEAIGSACPVLLELRVDLRVDFGSSPIDQKAYQELCSTLRERKRNVDNEKEVDGVKMVHLKKLVFQYHSLPEDQISALGDLVEQVVEQSTMKIDDFTVEVEV